MSDRWKEVARLHFKGARFRDHALDLTALNELRQFQKMVEETAKSLWKKANPDRDRLPQHFEDRTRLCLRRIVEGSAAAPLEVLIEEPEERELWEPEPVEVNEAIDLAYRVLEAVHEDAPLPDEFPRELLPEYKKWGQGLADDESMEFVPPGKPAVRVTEGGRRKLSALAEPPYEDEVDVTGHVLEADVRQRKFQIWLNARRNASVPFSEDQEAEITTALKEHKELRLRIRGRGEYAPQGQLKRVISVTDFKLVRDLEPAFDDDAPVIEDVIADIFKDVPEETWRKLPQDLTDRLDDYLYNGDEE